MSEQRIEIVTGRERRRRWSVEEKLRIVAATYEPGARVKQVAASYDIYPGLLFTWRRQVREGMLAPSLPPVFLPVRTAAPTLPGAVVRGAVATCRPDRDRAQGRQPCAG